MESTSRIARTVRRVSSRSAVTVLAGLCVAGFAAARLHADEGADPAAAVERAIAAAEESLRAASARSRRSHYRTALLEGWLLLGALEAAEGQLPEAREAFGARPGRRSRRGARSRRSPSPTSSSGSTQGSGHPGPPGARHPKDLETRRLLAQALVPHGQPEQAVQELEEAARRRSRRPRARLHAGQRTTCGSSAWHRPRLFGHHREGTGRSRRPTCSSAAPIATSGSTTGPVELRAALAAGPERAARPLLPRDGGRARRGRHEARRRRSASSGRSSSSRRAIR